MLEYFLYAKNPEFNLDKFIIVNKHDKYQKTCKNRKRSPFKSNWHGFAKRKLSKPVKPLQKI